MVTRSADRGVVTLYEYERGVLYTKGRFERILEPGRHRLWPFSGQRIVVVDVRQTTLALSGQKVLTADPLPVTVNAFVDYRIVDPVKALHETQDLRGRLHADLQDATRAAVAALPLQELLKTRPPVQPHTEAYGVEVLQAGIRDLILTPQVRDLVTKEAENRWTAQAALAGAREEVASLRALANAARIVRENPELLRLRELEVFREFSKRSGNTVVLGAQPLPKAGDPAPET